MKIGQVNILLSFLLKRLLIWKERFAKKANREFGLNKYTKTEICGLPTVEELRASLVAGEKSETREAIARLFDDKTFVEIGAYVKRGFSDFLSTEKANELEGVICGYGAINGKLVFAFAEDSSRGDGVIDERHAKKISDLYKLAIENGAPVIGIFDAKGTDIFMGTAGLAAYGRIVSCVSRASGVIPQIALKPRFTPVSTLVSTAESLISLPAAEMVRITPTGMVFVTFSSRVQKRVISMSGLAVP